MSCYVFLFPGNYVINVTLFHCVSLTNGRKSFDDEKIKQLVISLANNSDSQYVVFTEINDLSLTEQRTNGWRSKKIK